MSDFTAADERRRTNDIRRWLAGLPRVVIAGEYVRHPVGERVARRPGPKRVGSVVIAGCVRKGALSW